MDVAAAHWDKVYDSFTPYEISGNEDKYKFLDFSCSDLSGKKVLEIGCGRGDMSIYLAKKGAIVTAIDNTDNGVLCTQKMMDFNNVALNVVKLDAMQIDELENTFDYVVGRYILHHIEPFNQFVPKMSKVLNTGEKGSFGRIVPRIKF